MPDVNLNRHQFPTYQTRAPVFCKGQNNTKDKRPNLSRRKKKEDDGVASKHFKEVTAKVFKKRKRKVLSNFNPCQLYSGEQDWLYDVLLASLSPKLEQEILVGFQSILECVQ